MSYWTKRAQAERERANALGEQGLADELQALYDAQLAQLRMELDSYIQRFADSNGLTADAAHKRAEEFDVQAFEARAKQYVQDVDFSAKATKELRDYNFSMSVTRQELLIEEMQLELLKLGERERVLVDGYLRTGYTDELTRGTLLGQTVPDGDTLERLMMAAVNANFEGVKWSERIWQRQDLLRKTVSDEVTRALIRGDNGLKLARTLRNLFDVSMSNAKRLAVTEHARVQTMVQQQIMEDNGYTHFKLMPESKACDNCKRIGQETSDKPVPIKDMEVGKNAAPIHPNCRCAVAEVWID